MPVSTREDVLAALHARLATLSVTGGPLVLRNAALPARIPDAGCLILRDGKPGAPQVLLSPLTYCYQHRAEIELLVDTATDRDAAFDELGRAIASLIVADRSLGGRCNWLEAEAPDPVDLLVDGAEPIKAAVVIVVLHYDTLDPLN